MESSQPKRRFPPSWRVEESEHGFRVFDANGISIACVYFRDDLHAKKWAHYNTHLTSDEARRIAKAIANIPQLLKPRPGFDSRGGRDKRWRASHPYHVALADPYVREQWDRITMLCAYNGVPFNPTGERIDRDGLWCVYAFDRQIDAIMFWDEFKGRWLRYNEFLYPDRPNDLPKMRVPPNIDKLLPKYLR